MLKNIGFLTKSNKARVSLAFLPSAITIVILFITVIVFCALTKIPHTVPGVGLLLSKGNLKQIISSKTGTVERWLKEEGDVVRSTDTVAVIRSYEQHDVTYTITAGVDGVIAEIISYPQSTTAPGQALAIVTDDGDPKKDLHVLGFVSSLHGKKIVPGMRALVDPSITHALRDGQLRAHVKRVGKLPMTQTAVQSVIKIPEVARFIRNKIDAEPFIVFLSLDADESHVTGYDWNGPGPQFLLDSGIILEFAVTVSEPTLLELILPTIFRWRTSG